MIEYPTSLEDPRLDVYARLTELQLRNKLEPEKGIFIAESDKVIDRALAAAISRFPSWCPSIVLSAWLVL